MAVGGCRKRAKMVGKTLSVNQREIGVLLVVVIGRRLPRARRGCPFLFRHCSLTNLSLRTILHCSICRVVDCVDRCGLLLAGNFSSRKSFRQQRRLRKSLRAMADSRRVGPNTDFSQGTQGTQGSSQYRRSSYQRNERGRRSWTDCEEAVLISALKELVALGWKSDNGNYNLLSNILDRSGVGFNVHGDFKIDCSDDQWDQIVKQDKEARQMRTKSWPFWDDWKVIFGKDRATGQNAEGVAEAAKNSSPDEPVTDIGESTADYHPSFDDFIGYEQVHATFGNNVVDDSSAHSGQNTNGPPPAPPKHKRKRKVSDDESGIVEMLGKMHSETNARLDTLAARIGYEMDLGKARKEIFRHLCDIPELTEIERYDLCDIIGKENSRLEIFTGLPDGLKPGYVKRVLEKESRT
ncbi:hypothetical protein SASPL_105624 [Salvia splendens]|uniref:Myb/SANT-like domain-containing protein n=1 Tax=Salvia splendens TaxID=180675 RepID=A0A8X8YLQ9_SALSN|nr:hypothetical protein SASPL_105624 [Salvia splendens]